MPKKKLLIADCDEGCQTGVGQEQARSKARKGKMQEQGKSRSEVGIFRGYVP